MIIVDLGRLLNELVEEGIKASRKPLRAWVRRSVTEALSRPGAMTSTVNLVQDSDGTFHVPEKLPAKIEVTK